MKKRVSYVLAILGCVSLLGGCAAGVLPGGLYSGYTVGSSVGSANSGSKRGEACAVSVFGVIAVGDASVEAAMRDGKMTRVHTVNHDYTNILGLYMEACTVVRGE